MSRKKIYLYSGLAIIAFFAWIFSGSNEQDVAFSETAKIALREVGHKLLLTEKDSTSLVLPVIKLDESKYKLSFQNQFSINPDSLVSIVKKSLKKAVLSEFYIVEVIQCSDGEVAYSYKMRNEKDKNIIPCAGRFLPKNCYTINVRFLNRSTSVSQQMFLYALIVIVLIFLTDLFFNKKKQTTALLKSNENVASIGSFQFYPEQNKLVKQAIEISLSKKECELLEIFVANPNQIIKREELEKRVWEDNGVIVGRSLDTYISKLRKKLKEDDSIKLVNVHGVGYKLEVN
ncbi:winged helix-turn-helix domain-containing protein [Pontimicrobium sp. SW4]|uniref:Winged helix-turn-helix domain-containing protein n=1 Tax=Pontimicrobium sp. SW4 TaxID=3153519 RepID=A0AAU7BQ47_9FLAO